MKNNSKIVFVLLVLILLHLQYAATSARHVHHGKRHPIRKSGVDVNSFSVSKGKLSGAHQEKTMENGLRKKPPSSSNPSHNK
ncbi:hypothetical protein ABFS82_14G213400 [Erythranthe guttata]